MQAHAIEQIDVLGHKQMPMNVWGKTTLLLSLLYKAGVLPDCHIYAKDGEEGYFINGEFAGVTEEEVTTFVWRMVACRQANGYLFE